MIRRQTLVTLAALWVTAVATGARAQDAPAISLALTDCEFAPFDRAELTSRLALELELPPTAIAVAVDAAAPPSPATLVVAIDAPCAVREINLVATRDGREVGRSTADLGDTTGRPRAWALALLIAELVRTANAPAVPPPPPVRPQAPSRPPRQAVDDERPGVPRPRPRTFDTRFAIGADATLHLEELTVAPGLRAALAHDLLHVSLAVFAMDLSGALGSIAYAGLSLRIGARVPISTGAVGRLGLGAAAGGALVYATGYAASPGVAPSDGFDASAGASVSMWAEWPLSRTPGALAFDAELSVGYDVLGPTLQAGGDTVVSFRGLRIGLALSLAAPL